MYTVAFPVLHTCLRITNCFRILCLMLVMIHYIFAEEFLSEGGVWMKEEAVMWSDDVPGL